jgi:hypothetical protein
MARFFFFFLCAVAASASTSPYAGSSARPRFRKPFDPTETFCYAHILAARGLVHTGARAWTVHDGAKWIKCEVMAREVA